MQVAGETQRLVCWSARFWRLALLAGATLILCSCQSLTSDRAAVESPESISANGPLESRYVMKGEPPRQWSPPSQSGPWPRDEYLYDGGDRPPRVAIAPDWSIDGLHTEDTIVHYDLIDGGTEVETSNRVAIYSPRFGAVRHVTDPVGMERYENSFHLNQPVQLVRHDDIQVPTASVQPEQPIAGLAINQSTIMRARDGRSELQSLRHATGLSQGFLAYENLSIIRFGVYDVSEKAVLAERIDAAKAWIIDSAPSVMVEGHKANLETADASAQMTIVFDSPQGPSKMRIVKVASQKSAKPGEYVDFTIRFDNVGVKDVGNVTVVDNLTNRLEYVADSAQCDLKANFVTTPNEGGSSTLRWEIEKPLKPGQGGIVRFRCKVR